MNGSYSFECTSRDLFWCAHVPKFDPILNILGVFFPNFEKKIQIFNNFFFFGSLVFSFSQHTSYMVTFFFNLMAIVCVVVFFFLLTKNDITVHLTNFPI